MIYNAQYICFEREHLNIYNYILLSELAKHKLINETQVNIKYPTKTPEATISASGLFSSFKFHVPPTPRKLP